MCWSKIFGVVAMVNENKETWAERQIEKFEERFSAFAGFGVIACVLTAAVAAASALCGVSVWIWIQIFEWFK